MSIVRDRQDYTRLDTRSQSKARQGKTAQNTTQMNKNKDKDKTRREHEQDKDIEYDKDNDKANTNIIQEDQCKTNTTEDNTRQEEKTKHDNTKTTEHETRQELTGLETMW